MNSLATSLAVLLAGASTVSGTVFSLSETYDVSNFFEKFDFFESKYGTDNPNEHDPSHGFVNYKGSEAAFHDGLVKYGGQDVYIGVDSKNTWWDPDGRPSVRLESKNEYTKGLFIARFNHLPKRACGAWPAFWMYSPVGTWPKGGEIDIYENWNLATENHPAFHTGDTNDVGRCIISSAGITGQLVRPDCSLDDTKSGCSVADTRGPWAAEKGGIYAVEWTDSYIRVFTWSHADAPSNIDSRHPDTATWGKPVLEARDGLCNLKRQFAAQKLVLNIDFCGDAAGNPYLWGQDCKTATGQAECYEYVRHNPDAFKDVYFKVKDIRYFEEGYKPDPTSSTTTTTSTKTTTSTTSTSTSTATTTTTTSTTTSSTTRSSSSTTSTPTSTSTTTSSVPTSSSTSSSSSSVATSSSTSSSSTSSTTSSSSSVETSSSTTSSAPVTSSSTTTSSSSSQTSSSATSEPTSSSSGTSSSSATSETTTATTSETTHPGGSSTATSSPISSSSATTSSSVPASSGSSSSTLTPTATGSTSATTSSGSLPSSSTDVSTSSSATQSSSSSSFTVTTSSTSSIETSSSTSSDIPTSVSTSSTPSTSSSSSSDEVTTSTTIPTNSSSSTSGKPTSASTSSAPPSSGSASSTSSALPGTATSSTSAPVSTQPSSTSISTPAVTTSQEWTTSTVYTTTTYTITSCAPTVTNCPGKGIVVTETIPLYTTVCPITPTVTATPPVNTTEQPETVTTKITKVYTITSCAPTVTNCPVGKVTTEVVTSTLCPGVDKITNKTTSTSTMLGSVGCRGDGCATVIMKAISADFTSTTPVTTTTTTPIISTSCSTVITSTGVPVVTSTATHVASTGIVPSSTHKSTGTEVPVTGFAAPSKPISKAVTLVAGMMVAALFL